MDRTTPRTSLLSDFGLFYCSAVWGATFYMVKDALLSVDPIALVAYRFLLSAGCLLPWVAARRGWRFHLKEGAVLGALLATLYVSQTVGLQYTTASNSGFITGLFVLFVPIFLLVLFRAPPTKSQWAATGIASAGLCILTGGPNHFNLGDGLTLISAMAYAGHLLATDRYVKRDADALLLAFQQFWMTGLGCLLLASMTRRPLEVRTLAGGGVILFLAVVPTLSAFFIQMLAQKFSSPVKVALIFSTEPVFAAAFAWTLGHEPFAASSLVGGGLIVLGMVGSELSKRPLRPSPGQEVLPAQ